MNRKPNFKLSRVVGNKRRGVATLEFVMAMPTLFLMMVGIVWLGYSNIYQAEVAIKAKNDAWRTALRESRCRSVDLSDATCFMTMQRITV